MGYYEIGAHFGTSKTENGYLFSVDLFILHGKIINLILR